MSGRAQTSRWGRTAAVMAMSLALAGSVGAQTTVVLNDPNAGVADAYIRAGDHANVVNNTGVLVTKANSNPSYVRRALLKFDTETTIPANAAIQSATLTLTLRASEASTRTLSAFRIASSFDEAATTWYRRKEDGRLWATAGGDLGTRYATATVGTAPGAQVTFNVTALVQAAVNGTYGSRYTRVALVDEGASSASSYKEFFSSEASDAAIRPVLAVTYGTPTAAPAPSSGTTLKVLHWNTHYGIGTDGAYGIDKHVDWILRINPDVVSLNEVEKFTSRGNENQPALFASKLQARTGQPWYYHFAQRYGNWSSNGCGNLILSRFPLDATSQLAMSYGRSAALATITVNGRAITLISTHLASESSGYRSMQIQQLLTWARSFSEQRIIAGDFNAGLSNVPYVETEYDDGWTAALAARTAQDYPGNYRAGSTFINGYRIDFVFKSGGAANLLVREARVYDTREANGVMPSDHKPLTVTYELR